MTVLVSRLVTATVFSTTLSLLLTVLSITAIEAHKLRWDGSFCRHDACAATAVAASKPKPHASLQARML